MTTTTPVPLVIEMQVLGQAFGAARDEVGEATSALRDAVKEGPLFKMQLGIQRPTAAPRLHGRIRHSSHEPATVGDQLAQRMRKNLPPPRPLGAPQPIPYTPLQVTRRLDYLKIENTETHQVAYFSDISTSADPGNINDLVEREFVAAETTLDGPGSTFGLSILSGAWRILLGIGMLICALVLIVLKFCHAAYIRITSGKEFARLPFQEGKRALLYIPHALANMIRGAFEMAQLVSLATCLKIFDPGKRPFPYPLEKNPTPEQNSVHRLLMEGADEDLAQAIARRSRLTEAHIPDPLI